jgi:lipopolysaccharide/colanic/teichoic acid biosynthesis glycosyltransferase
MYRFFDIFFSLLGLTIVSPMLFTIYIISLLDTGSPFFCQQRVGRNQAPFILLKFRTMRIHTESVASHLVDPSAVTPWGALLRRTKLDELPQLLRLETLMLANNRISRISKDFA